MIPKPSASVSNAGFVHLHVHSAYSLLKGSIKIQKLAELAKADRQPALIVLLAARERGYRSLMRLNSRAFLETPVHQAPHVKFEWLQGDAEDLIALTGGPSGPISLAIDADHAGLAAARCDQLAR